ncbi:hypothetical protein IV500_03835 [Paeniglutamicibacter antarcticus]|uniref:D-3-phosphoglycerate dehydrogenase n=1 Tax=Arthrobacter terrae TaxID=2935737 RepID=A0A931G9C1_9MICC|nr:hypothetical protein [Arthrobacter terrae]MBG0738552.1 hypothetical protein [Arthrobacter terrae]
MVRRLAILDDYQCVAAGFAPWHELEDIGIETTFLTAHLGGEDAVVERLRGFEIEVAMRERTPFPRDVLERQPDLRLLVTTGMRNAAIDLGGGARVGHCRERDGRLTGACAKPW